MAIELFGFEIKSKKGKKGKTFVTPENTDGATTVVDGGGILGHYLNTDADAKNEKVLVQKYREMSFSQEVDGAVEDIVNDAIIQEEGQPAIALDLGSLDYTDAIKDKMHTEFSTILDLLDFNLNGADLFRKWYIDARLYHHIVIDTARPKDGIKELIPIDPLNIEKIREVQKSKTGVGEGQVEVVENVQEYYVYTPDAMNVGSWQQGAAGQFGAVQVAPDAISYVHSGLIDTVKQIVVGYLFKAIKPWNQLRMIEDALVIYRLARAPERRIFYIDVGNLPKLKAEQYLQQVMNRYKQKMIYNASSGEVEDQRKHLSMLEDFWLPRREGGRGTEISTLPGGQNLGETDDIEYFRKKLYKSLNVPITRIEGADSTTFNLGRASEITRDEVKFGKFVSRLRHRFSGLFTELLRVQLILKGIIKEEDWVSIKDRVRYVWAKDSHFMELKQSEMLRDRFELLSMAEEYAGKYVSVEYLRKNILQQTEEQIKEIDKQIAAEKPEDDDDDDDDDDEDF
jgi:hypothetical protein